MTLAPRVVVIHRRTELEELLDRHGTRGQVEFFLQRRGRDLAEVQARHDAVTAALHTAAAAVPVAWRRGTVERGDLDRFLFDPADIVVAVGQDGLVANVAKYLHGQPVIGVDPEPGRGPAVLVPHAAADVARLLAAVAAGTAPVLARTMAAAVCDDGQELVALNEIYLGHPSHQSARYLIRTPHGRSEQQSSSGLVAGTSTGATGWCASLHPHYDHAPTLPGAQDRRLAWFVREAWPSPSTGISCTAGTVGAGESLEVAVATDALVLFGDGVESDRLTVTWGQRVMVQPADRVLVHVAVSGRG
jgi:NAD kinase